MITQQGTQAQEITLNERRLFLQLPLEERRRRLAEQADRAVASYNEQPAKTERLEWQGDDIVEY